MRQPLIATIILLVIGSTVFAGDYIRIGVDSIPAGMTNVQIPFFIERTCPVPPAICGVSLGFEMTATGDASWTYLNIAIDPVAYQWFSWNIFPYPFFDNVSPDSFALGGDLPATALPSCMPVVEDTFLFSLILDVGEGEGDICIDSAFLWPALPWKFSGLTCGQGGAPDRPLFVDKYGSDDNHPVHITIYKPLCGDVTLDGVVDIDDPVFLVSYVFTFGPAPNPMYVGDCDCSGGSVPVDIDDIVHLMDYILRGGPEPCDVDGDGVPDC